MTNKAKQADLTNLYPPTETTADQIYNIIESLLGGLPLGGSVAVTLFNTFLSKPIEERKQKWMERVAEVITNLCKNKMDTENLLANDRFIDAVLTISRMALEISDEEKLNNYKKLLIGLYQDKEITFDQQQIAISALGDISSNQLIILKEILEQKNELKFSVETSHMFSKSEVIKAVTKLNTFDQFRSQDNFDLILLNLIDNSFIEYYSINNNVIGTVKSTPHYLILTKKSKLIFQLLDNVAL